MIMMLPPPSLLEDWTMPIKLYSSAFLFVLLCFSAQGCSQTCDQLCEENAYYIQGCLETWDALWSDLGYDGRILVAGGDGQEEALSGGPGEEYVQSCRSRYSEAMGRSVPEEQTSIRYECSQDLQALAMSVGCFEYSPNGLTLDPTAN